jgi:hypothetical protein
MKHIFFIHSYITYLVSLKVIEKEHLDKQDCAFLINRKIIINDVIATYDIEQFGSAGMFPINRNLSKSWSALKSIDIFIDKITGHRPYFFYCPQTSLRIISAFITNRRCKGFNLIEEGLASYFERGVINKSQLPERQSLKVKLNKILGYGNRLPNLHFFDSGYKKAYGISEHSFPSFRDKVVLGNYFIKSNGHNHEYDHKHILVFDALIEAKLVTSEQYLQALESLIEYFIRGSIKDVYFKLHPEQLKAYGSSEIVRAFLNKVHSVRFKELPPDTILEQIIAFNSNLTLYIVISSVGLYAAFAGHKVYSFINHLQGVDGKLANSVEKLPAVFFRHIERI